MNCVFSQKKRPFTPVSLAAIAIKANSCQQRHLGVLYQSDGSNAHYLHLAWHHSLQNGVPPPDCLWITPAVPSRRLRQVAAFRRMLWNTNGKRIPYAFSSPIGALDILTGQFLLGPTRHGLTCATFVLALFEAVGIRLVIYESWPRNRAGDREWQMEIAESLKTHPKATPEHIHAIESEIGSLRFRPEDVAGAATVTELPADFAAASDRAEMLLQLLYQTPV